MRGTCYGDVSTVCLLSVHPLIDQDARDVCAFHFIGLRYKQSSAFLFNHLQVNKLVILSSTVTETKQCSNDPWYIYRELETHFIVLSCIGFEMRSSEHLKSQLFERFGREPHMEATLNCAILYLQYYKVPLSF